MFLTASQVHVSKIRNINSISSLTPSFHLSLSPLFLCLFISLFSLPLYLCLSLFPLFLLHTLFEGVSPLARTRCKLFWHWLIQAPLMKGKMAFYSHSLSDSWGLQKWARTKVCAWWLPATIVDVRLCARLHLWLLGGLQNLSPNRSASCQGDHS